MRANGGIYGAHLSTHNDVDVWAYDTDRNHVDAINQSGLLLTGARQYRAEIHATSDASQIPDCDVGIIATKVLHTKDVIEATANAFQDCFVSSLQNGIGNEDIIAEFVPNVLSDTTLVGGHITCPGVVESDTNESTWIGPAEGSVRPDDIQQLADLLTASGLSTSVVSNIKGMKWTKLIFNAAANPPCALTRVPFGEVYNQTPLRELLLGLAREGMEVSNALGVTLDSGPVELSEKASKSSSSHIPSMLADVLSEKRTEIDALNGRIVTYRRKLDVPCPLNELAVALIKGLESSW